MYRKTYAVIDSEKLKRNTKEIIKKYSKYNYYIAVVKNNAYHHGIKIVNDLIEAGINYLAVSSLEEALDIRKINNEIPILVLEPISPEFIDDCQMNTITLMIENLEELKKLNEKKLTYPQKVHLKIDSGMNRLGFKERTEIKEAVKIIETNEKIVLEGLFTHFATSGRNDNYYDQQLATFKELTKDMHLKDIPIIHIDRSLTFVSHKKPSFVTGVRLGIVLFGFNGSIKPTKNIKGKLSNLKRQFVLKRNHISESILENHLKLETAFSLYSTVMSIRTVKKGEIVGYNGFYKAKKEERVATLPIGYADGVTKEFQNVAINGKKYKIINDAMDMLSVLVDESVKIDDKVEIFGETISIKEVTTKLNINSYHLFNLISNRVPRIHKDKEKEIEIKY